MLKLCQCVSYGTKLCALPRTNPASSRENGLNQDLWIYKNRAPNHLTSEAAFFNAVQLSFQVFNLSTTCPVQTLALWSDKQGCIIMIVVCLRDVDLGVLCPFLSIVFYFRFRVMVVLSMTIVTKGNQPITK